MSEKTNQALQEEIQQLREQLKQLEVKVQKAKRIGHIYAFIHRRYKTYDYVGHHIGSDIKGRLATHIQDLEKYVRLPFYKLLVQQAIRKQYKQVLLETIEFTEDEELFALEKKYQKEYKSFHKVNELFCQGCKKTYKQIASFISHREKCSKLLKYPESSSSDSDVEPESQTDSN